MIETISYFAYDQPSHPVGILLQLRYDSSRLNVTPNVINFSREAVGKVANINSAYAHPRHMGYN